MSEASTRAWLPNDREIAKLDEREKASEKARPLPPPVDDKTFRSLPEDVRRALIRSNRAPDDNPGAGQLRAIETRDRLTGRLITNYEGDPEVWLRQFKPAMKFSVRAFRGNSTDEQWNERLRKLNNERAALNTRNKS